MAKMGSATHLIVVEYMTRSEDFKMALESENNYLISWYYCRLVQCVKDAYLSGIFSDSEFTEEMETIATMYLQRLAH